MDFVGCKAAFFHGESLLTYLRDDKPGLPWPAHWDLPGGGKEGDETAEACLLRELQEEFGLTLPADRLIWRRVLPSMMDANRDSVFFAGKLTDEDIASIRFGDEGQYWKLMRVDDFLAHPSAVPELQRRVALVLASL